MLPLITEIPSMKAFGELLEKNPGVVIIKFGAEWCAPCKKVEGLVHEWFNMMPDTVQCVLIDVDESFELYAFMKNKKMMQGIPAILGYHRGNLSYVPSDSIVGADPVQIKLFFERCLSKAASSV